MLVKVLSTQSCPTLCNPMDRCPIRLLCPWNSPGKNAGVVSPSPGDLPNPEIKPGSLTLQADSLPLETPGKPLGYENDHYIPVFKRAFSLLIILELMAA